MENSTNYTLLLQSSYFDLALGCTILIGIAALVGIAGNLMIIFFYFFRIKDRGERYYIPILAVIDFLASITSSLYNIMDNSYFYNYPNDVICRLLSALQVCVPGISAHVLLLISIQRYLLVCKPFGPKMTLYWKRVALGLVCGITVVYSVPILGTAGVKTSQEVYLNHNVTVKICKFSADSSSYITIYFGILSLIIIGNIVATGAFYIPVLKQVRIAFRSFRRKVANKYKEDTVPTELEAVSDSNAEQIEMKTISVSNASTPATNELPVSNLSPGKNAEPGSITETDDTEDVGTNNPNISKNENTDDKPKEMKETKSKRKSVQRRLTMMFFVLILAYIISYIPPLVFLVLTYAIENFNFLTLTKTESVLWIYLPRLVFLNHVINPFIYGYYDTKLRDQLTTCFKRKRHIIN
ncbi:5-hydroxytryptamine receptor 1A-beta-like [Saccostrea cucullata]|uniref:5-hydroxytryptamine receptor 1A-beta-like n=1 Tax=Saccostrea cuccullata TaxID=36930 RepID=UPI002ED4B0FF